MVPKVNLEEAPASVHLYLELPEQGASVIDAFINATISEKAFIVSNSEEIAAAISEKVNLDNVKPMEGYSWRVLPSTDAKALYLDAILKQTPPATDEPSSLAEWKIAVIAVAGCLAVALCATIVIVVIKKRAAPPSNEACEA